MNHSLVLDVEIIILEFSLFPIENIYHIQHGKGINETRHEKASGVTSGYFLSSREITYQYQGDISYQCEEYEFPEVRMKRTSNERPNPNQGSLSGAAIPKIMKKIVPSGMPFKVIMCNQNVEHWY